jgi:diphthamide synthase (EF-2-diphthine--ammonia ligase)
MRGVFPIWKEDSRALIREFFALGFGTVTCCVNDAWLGEADVGRKIDEEFIRSLPANVDPCGENGEFHSFAFAGPIFKEPVQFSVGEKVYRPVEVTPPTDSGSSYVCPSSGPKATKGFWFCDLLPA